MVGMYDELECSEVPCGVMMSLAGRGLITRQLLSPASITPACMAKRK
jgi:hypothetical protein